MSVNHLANMQNKVAAPTTQDMSMYMKWCQGIEGAKAYLLAPGVTLPIWDSENPVIYVKSTDQNGIPLPMTIIDYTIREPKPEEDSPYASKEDLSGVKDDIANLTKLVMELSEKLDRKPSFNKKKGGYQNE